jgi:predicted PurR-regulated permease PerM
VTTFFLLNDGAKLKEGLIRLSPPRYRMRLANLFEPVANQLGAYVRGQLTVISFLVTYLAIALSIARVPFSLVLALIAGLLDIIPMVGILGVIPAALVALTVSWKLSLLVVVLFTVGNFLEGNVISPLILSKSVDVPPILIFFSLMIGAQFMGIVGALLAVPVTAAALVIVKNLYLPSIEEERE